MKRKAIICLGIFIIIFGAAALSEYWSKTEAIKPDDFLFPIFMADLEDQEIPFGAREYIRVETK